MNIQRIFVAIASLAGCVLVFMPFAKPIIVGPFNLFDVHQVVGYVVLAAFILTFLLTLFGNKKKVLSGFGRAFAAITGVLPSIVMVAVLIVYKQMKMADKFSRLDYSFYAIIGVSVFIFLLCVLCRRKKDVVAEDVITEDISTELPDAETSENTNTEDVEVIANQDEPAEDTDSLDNAKEESC